MAQSYYTRLAVSGGSVSGRVFLVLELLERLEQAIQRAPNLGRQLSRDRSRFGEQLPQARGHVLDSCGVSGPPLSLVDGEDDVAVLTRDGCRRRSFFQHAPANFLQRFARGSFARLGTAEKINRLVTGDGLVKSVSRKNRGSASLKKRKRAGELVHGFWLQSELGLRIRLERIVAPPFPAPTVFGFRQRFAELEPARFELTRATQELGTLGVVGVSAFGVGKGGVRLRAMHSRVPYERRRPATRVDARPADGGVV